MGNRRVLSRYLGLTWKMDQKVRCRNRILRLSLFSGCQFYHLLFSSLFYSRRKADGVRFQTHFMIFDELAKRKH